jgi:hypothetical protein
MSSSYEDETNPFQQEPGFETLSGVSSPSVEHVSFTPEGTAADSSQSTVNGQFLEEPRSTYGNSQMSSPVMSIPSGAGGYKNEIDRILHTGDDVQILVCSFMRNRLFANIHIY